jgi:hypothetical protein
VSRNHQTPGIIRVLCTSSYHHDSLGFAERGFRYLCTLKLAYRQGGPGPLSRSSRAATSAGDDRRPRRSAA